MKILTLLQLIVFFPILLYSQLQNPFNVIKQNDFLNAVIIFDSIENNYVDSEFNNAYWQAKGTLYAFIGKYAKADECYSKFETSQRKEVIKDVLSFTWKHFEDTLDYYNVIVLNEAHNKSAHRATLYYMLPRLKEMGYKYLAIEALNNEQWLDSTIHERKYPTSKTGFYIQDPIFNLTIRKAIEIGFELIAYDSYKDFSKREILQAENISNHYLQNKEKGKLIVYAGYAHACEAKDYGLMAYQLKSKINEEVLTLNQVSKKEYNVQKQSPFTIIKEADEGSVN